MKVVFFGSSDYCLPVLESLKNNLDLSLVITRPDKPVGRKQILTPSPVKLWAQENGIPVVTDLTTLLPLHLAASPPFDLGLVADFGSIIPENIFAHPRLGTFNIHFSKLPDLRGASPVQACLLRGDTTAWITIFKLEKTLDTGPILWQKEYPILPDDTAQSLYLRLFEEVSNELPEIINSLSTNRSPLTPQVGPPSYCKILTRQDGFVDWNIIHNTKYMVQTYNRYRAYYPWPGLWTIAPEGNPTSPSGLRGARRMKILKCHLANNKLVLDQIQFEGEKPKSPSQGLSL